MLKDILGKGRWSAVGGARVAKGTKGTSEVKESRGHERKQGDAEERRKGRPMRLGALLGGWRQTSEDRQRRRGWACENVYG